MYFQVIMPVGADPASSEKEEIIRKTAAAKQLNAHFPRYTSQDPVFNLQSSLQDLRGAEFVIADLSLERPSCYYELGLAEALGKPIFLLAQAHTNIHQTAARRSVRFFEGLGEFKNVIDDIITQVARRDESTGPIERADASDNPR